MNGNNIIVYQQSGSTWTAIAATKSDELQVSAGTIEIANADEKDWTRCVAGRKSWGLTTNWLVTTVNDIEKADTVIVAYGQNFPDALSISPYAYATKTPIVLTNAKGTLDGATLEAIRSISPSNVALVGGSGVVSDDVAGQIGSNVNVQRLSGTNRYETSAAIAQWEAGQLRSATVKPKAPLSFEYVGIATGKNFPDALAGAAMMGRSGGVMLLVDGAKSTGFNIQYTVPNNKAAMRACYVFGGESAVSEATMEALEQASRR